MRKINKIVVHCTATKEGRDHSVEEVRSWHRQRGWSDIGYHFLIRLDGTVEHGRPIEQAGAHAKNNNKKSIGIVYVGGLSDNLKPKDTRTDAQKEALISLIRDLKQEHPTAEILGHRDLPGVRKACPCFDAVHEYNKPSFKTSKPVRQVQRASKITNDYILVLAKRLGLIKA